MKKYLVRIFDKLEEGNEVYITTIFANSLEMTGSKALTEVRRKCQTYDIDWVALSMPFESKLTIRKENINKVI